MAAQTDVRFGLQYGWTLGEYGWNVGMDANILKLARVGWGGDLMVLLRSCFSR